MRELCAQAICNNIRELLPENIGVDFNEKGSIFLKFKPIGSLVFNLSDQPIDLKNHIELVARFFASEKYTKLCAAFNCQHDLRGANSATRHQLLTPEADWVFTASGL
jgi:hypothetical protein